MSPSKTILLYLEASAYRGRYVLLWVAVILCGVQLYSGILQVEGYPRYALSEMLISYSDGFTRRGLGGEVVLMLSAAFGGEPAFWSWGVLCVFGGVLVILCGRIFARLPENQPELVVLVLAPWGLLFLAYDYDSAFRKEMFGFIALAMILSGALAGSPKAALRWLWGSAGAMVIAVLMHEANVLIGPSILMAAGLMAHAHPSARRIIAGVTIVTAVVCCALVLVFSQLEFPDPEILCAAAREPYCAGPFEYLDMPFEQARDFRSAHVNMRKVFVYVFQFSLCLLAFLGFTLDGRRRWLWIAIGVQTLAILPLFYLAVDWGRWLHMISFSLSLVFCTGVILGVVKYRRVFPAGVTLIYICSWSIDHFLGAFEWQAGGLLAGVLGAAAFFAFKDKRSDAL